jgi:hypothetical protein
MIHIILVAHQESFLVYLTYDYNANFYLPIEIKKLTHANILAQSYSKNKLLDPTLYHQMD